MEDESKETASLSWIWWAISCKIGQSVLRNLKDKKNFFKKCFSFLLKKAARILHEIEIFEQLW